MKTSKITEIKNVLFDSLNKQFKEKFKKDKPFKNNFDSLLREKMNNTGLDYLKPKIFDEIK